MFFLGLVSWAFLGLGFLVITLGLLVFDPSNIFIMAEPPVKTKKHVYQLAN